MQKDYLRIGNHTDLKEPKEKIIFRLLEIFPGALSWLTLFLVILLSFLKPLWVAVFIILFVIFWFFRTIYFIFHLRAGYQQMRKNENTDWLKKLKTLKLKNKRNWRDIYHLVVVKIGTCTFLLFLRYASP